MTRQLTRSLTRSLGASLGLAFLAPFVFYVAACDDDVRSAGDGTFNAAGGGGVKYERDSGSTRLPIDGGAPAPPTCAAYCDAYGVACGFGTSAITLRVDSDGGVSPLPDAGPAITGTSGYLDRATCVALCEALPKGEWAVGADEVVEAARANTVVCRYATLERTADALPELSKEERCAIAGPMGIANYRGGGGANCSEACDSYCTLAVATCATFTLDGSAPQMWTAGSDLSACQADCLAGGAVTAQPYVNGLAANDRGNTLNCRVLQVERATNNKEACLDVGWLVPNTSACLFP